MRGEEEKGTMRPVSIVDFTESNYIRGKVQSDLDVLRPIMVVQSD
jgi:hypothetical protein